MVSKKLNTTISVLVSENIEHHLGVTHGFTNRFGGVSSGIYASLNLGINTGDDLAKVTENYSLLCSATDIDLHKTVLSKQVHTDHILTVSTQHCGCGLFKERDYEVDGLITNIPNIPLFVFSADCIPVLLFDPVSRSIGAVHAGWRGTAMAIVKKAVNQMGEAFDAMPENILAAIGPGIGTCCFETDHDVPEKILELIGESARPFLKNHGNKWHVDLKGINSMLLSSAGLKEENIDIASDCTMCMQDKYWSHRATKGQRGSQASFIVLK